VPEGHTLHRLARANRLLLTGKVVRASSPQGRFVEGAALLNGRQFISAEAYGKHLFHRYEGLSDRLHIHLGLYGKFLAHAQPAPVPIGAVRLRLETDTDYLELRGATQCELITPPERRELLARLGPDPLRPGADPERAWQRIRRSKTSIGQLLMNQDVLAGVGNVYRAEVLFRAQLAPHRPGQEVTEAEFTAMWSDIVTLMRAGMRTGVIVTTLRGDRDRRSGPARPEDRHYVYRRTGLPCRRCGTPIRTEVLATRNLFWCPTCQPR
jgi:endonuclease-8